MSERERRIIEKSRKSHKHKGTRQVAFSTLVISVGISAFLSFNLGKVVGAAKPDNTATEYEMTDSERDSLKQYEDLLEREAREKSYQEGLEVKAKENEQIEQEQQRMEQYEEMLRKQQEEEFRRHQEDISRGRGEL